MPELNSPNSFEQFLISSWEASGVFDNQVVYVLPSRLALVLASTVGVSS